MTPDHTPPAKSHRWLRRLGVVAAVLLLLALAFAWHVWPALGSAPDGERLAQIQQSPNHRDGRFANALPTLEDGASWETAWRYLTGGSDVRKPSSPVEGVMARSVGDLAEPADLRVTWLGHSTMLVDLEGARFLVDPVWSEHAAPSPLLGVRRFYEPPLALDDLPVLDAVVISHDHYDHLDMPTIQALAARVSRFVVPLGVGSHLESWGVPREAITELDWWDGLEVGGVRLVSTPARHFSGRSLTDRDQTLWSGWAFVGAERRVFYSGDTALSPDFLEVGERLGPFDMTLIESGAYDAAWADVHLGPEQAVAVHRMVRGGLMVPVHWGLFDLALHGWTEPAERVRAAAERAGVEVAFPRPGESVTLDSASSRAWWPDLPWETAAEAPAVSSGLPDSVLALIP